MVVVFKLVPDREDLHGFRILYLVQRDRAAASECNWQFAQERALAGLAEDERGTAQMALKIGPPMGDPSNDDPFGLKLRRWGGRLIKRTGTG